MIYALCLPLAVLLGYFLAEPMGFGAIALVGVLFLFLTTPLLMTWYHPLLVLTWNAALQPFFLPGQPFLWMILAFMGLGFAVLNRFTTLDAKFVEVPCLVRPLLFLSFVVIVTAWMRGGVGIRVLGGASYGGKSYIGILASIAGFFALISQRIPKHRAKALVGLFFLSGLTALVPNLAFLGGKPLEFLFYLFPPAYAMEQAVGEFGMDDSQIYRFGGLTAASTALCCWLLATFGFRGLFTWIRPWRFLLMVATLVGAAFCGYRSVFILVCLIVFFQFCAEGLFRGRILAITFGVLILVGAGLVGFADRLPPVVQRTISFLPVEVKPEVRVLTQGSSSWRLEMWRDLLPEVPKYLLGGKGYAVNPTELRFLQENAHRGFTRSYEGAIITGSYHNGPLSVAIPFGVWGLIGFSWFMIAGLKYLFIAYRNGDSEFRTMNSLLLAFFAARLMLFIFVFGMLPTDLFYFTGVLGLSVSLNGAEVLRQRPALEAPEEAFTQVMANREML